VAAQTWPYTLRGRAECAWGILLSAPFLPTSTWWVSKDAAKLIHDGFGLSRIFHSCQGWRQGTAANIWTFVAEENCGRPQALGTRRRLGVPCLDSCGVRAVLARTRDLLVGLQERVGRRGLFRIDRHRERPARIAGDLTFVRPTEQERQFQASCNFPVETSPATSPDQ
jgi:hypothetical protein